MFGAMRAAGLSGVGEVIIARVEMASVQRAMNRMLTTMEGKAATRALAEVGKFGRDKVKSDVPGKYKSVRKAIAWRHVKRRYNSGNRAVKVGGGVGPNLLLKRRELTEKQQSKADKLREKIATTQQRRKDKRRPGVGISKNNVHWWFLGTAMRTTGVKTVRRRVRTADGKTTIRRYSMPNGKPMLNRGRMPKMGKPIMMTLASNGSGIRNIIRVHMSREITIEAAKNK